MKLLIVEDHPSLRDLLSQRLLRCGYSVDVAEDGQAAMALLNMWRYDLLILDLGLPDIDGLQLLKKLRRQQQFSQPCLILSARDALQNRIDGLDAGADDYLVKPFDVNELEARLRALLRRPRELEDDKFELGNLCLFAKGCEVRVAGQLLALARREYLLLSELMRQAGRVVIKNQLEDRIYGCAEASSLNAVEALVSRLRRKLADVGADITIETVRGLGYRLFSKQHAH